MSYSKGVWLYRYGMAVSRRNALLREAMPGDEKNRERQQMLDAAKRRVDRLWEKLSFEERREALLAFHSSGPRP